MTKKKINKCLRCNTPYSMQDIWICPCHPMFDPNKKWEDLGGDIEITDDTLYNTKKTPR